MKSWVFLLCAAAVAMAALAVPTRGWVSLLCFVLGFGLVIVAILSHPPRVRHLPASPAEPPRPLPFPAPYCGHDEYSDAERAILELRPGQTIHYNGEDYRVDSAISVALVLGNMPLLADHWFKLTGTSGSTAWMTANETNYRVLHGLTWLVPCSFDGPMPTRDDHYVTRGGLSYTRGFVAQCPYFPSDDYLGDPTGYLRFINYHSPADHDTGLRFLSLDGGETEVLKFKTVPVEAVSIEAARCE